jgi:hypothetical protein
MKKSSSNMNMDIYLYTALKKRVEAEKILKEANYLNRPKTPGQMADMLEHLVSQGGKEALMKIIKIHPDYDMIIQSYKDNLPKSADGQDEMSADAVVAKETTPKNNTLTTTQLLIVSGAAVLTVTLIAMMVIKK